MWALVELQTGFFHSKLRSVSLSAFGKINNSKTTFFYLSQYCSEDEKCSLRINVGSGGCKRSSCTGARMSTYADYACAGFLYWDVYKIYFLLKVWPPFFSFSDAYISNMKSVDYCNQLIFLNRFQDQSNLFTLLTPGQGSGRFSKVTLWLLINIKYIERD